MLRTTARHIVAKAQPKRLDKMASGARTRANLALWLHRAVYGF
jgi:hypothetical protein